MNQNNRFCIIKGHEEYPVFHICTLIDCNQISRWSCVECVQKGIYNHSKSNNSHIMNRKEILHELMTKYEKFNNLHKSSSSNLLEKILNQCQSLEKFLIDYMKQIVEDQARFQQYLGYLYDNSFFELDDDKIHQLINFSKQQFDQHKQIIIQQPFDKIQQQLKQLETMVKEYQDHQIGNSIIDVKNRKYFTEQIDQGNDHYLASSISSNYQQLSYGVYYGKILKIYDIQQKKINKEIQLDSSFRVCQFSKDSSQLYVGLDSGFVCGYDAQDDYNEIYKQQIHLSFIYNLIIINKEYLLTCSEDKFIIKTHIQSQQQIIKLTGHTSCIIGMDYNDKDDIIASCSADKSIKLWNCGNQSLIINKKKAHNITIRQIQFINNNSDILSLDQGGTLHKWNIDFINKDLIKLQSFSDDNKIFNFSQVLQNQCLLIICNKYVKILNQQGETLNTIYHNGGLNPYTFDCRQLDNLNYILIRADSKNIFINRENHFSHRIRLKNIIKQNTLIYNQLKKQLKELIEIINMDIYTLAPQIIKNFIMRIKII